MASPAVRNAIDSVAAIRGITQSYVDFTTKLVTDVMNALVASSISQMRAYADLVASLERGLKAYQAQITTPQAVVSWLESRVPETGSDPSKLTLPNSLSEASADAIANLYSTKLLSILGKPTGVEAYALTNFVPPSANLQMQSSQLKGQALTALQIPALDGIGAMNYTDGTALPSPDVNGYVAIDLLSAVKTMMADDAQTSYQQLDTLVKMGMLRIVITDGHILTKMTFEMHTADASQSNSSDAYGSSFAASAKAGASWGWGAASLKASYSNFNVRVASEHSQTSTDILVTMIGEVLVNYRSDYYPQLPSQAKP